ncbi:MAG: hypothetical protein ACLSVD_16975 [Eggerthellaceae bacterium]
MDNFRSYNDAYGYAVGDAIAARFGRYLQTSLDRREDGGIGQRGVPRHRRRRDRDVWTASRAICLRAPDHRREGPSGESTSVSLTAGAGACRGTEAA